MNDDAIAAAVEAFLDFWEQHKIDTSGGAIETDRGMVWLFATRDPSIAQGIETLIEKRSTEADLGEQGDGE